MKPLVSVCIPTYNGALFLKHALESVEQQTYGNLEIIVSDDASSDNTLNIIEVYKANTDIPVYVFHHIPNGIGANWNNCIRKSNGTYIKFLFQDDRLLPNCIEEMINVLETDNSIGLVTSKRTFIIDKNYSFPGMADWIENFEDLQKDLNLKVKDGLSVIDKSLFKSNQFLRTPLNKIGEPSVTLFRKNIVNTVGYFREDLKQILDYEFYYRLLKAYKIAVINKSLVQFRLHEKQTTNINRINNMKGSNENEGYSKILYKDYLHFVDTYTKIHLLKKHNLFYRIYYRLKRIFIISLKEIKF